MVIAPEAPTSVPSQPPIGPEPAGASRRPSPAVWVMLVAGVLLAGFGVFRFLAPDTEIEKLHDDLAAIQDERADVEASVADVQERVATVTESSATLETDVTAMMDAFETYVTSYEATVTAFNTAYTALFEQGLPAAQSLVDGQLTQAVSDSEAALVDLQDAITSVLTTLSDLDEAATAGSGT